MANPQLIEYIQQAKAIGKSREEIKNILLNAGWQSSDIDQALAVSFDSPSSFIPQPPVRIGRFKASRMLVSQSWQILKKDKEIILFPILSAFTILVVFSPLIILLILYGVAHGGDVKEAEKSSSAMGYVILFFVYLVSYFIGSFFQAGLVTVVHGRLNNQNLSFKDGFSNAFKHKAKIFAWALLASTVGVILNMIAERVKMLGKLIAWLLGTAWSLITFFIVPVLILDNLSLKESIKKSGFIFKKTWGETAIMNISTSLFFMLLYILGVVIFIGIFVLSIFLKTPIIILIDMILLVIYFVSLAIISSSLAAIFRVALYEYADKGIVPQGFSAELIQNAIRQK